MNAPAPPEVYLTLTGPINQPMAASLINNLTLAAKKRAPCVHLLVQSQGGAIDDGIALYNFIRNLPLDVVVYNGGSVCSIAVVMFLGAKARKASKTAQFMIHKSHWSSPNERVTADRAKLLAKNLSANDSRIEGILREHIQMPQNLWNIHKTDDLFVGAADALKFKIIDEICDFQPPNTVELFNVSPIP